MATAPLQNDKLLYSYAVVAEMASIHFELHCLTASVYGLESEDSLCESPPCFRLQPSHAHSSIHTSLSSKNGPPLARSHMQAHTFTGTPDPHPSTHAPAKDQSSVYLSCKASSIANEKPQFLCHSPSFSIAKSKTSNSRTANSNFLSQAHHALRHSSSLPWQVPPHRLVQ